MVVESSSRDGAVAAIRPGRVASVGLAAELAYVDAMLTRAPSVPRSDASGLAGLERIAERHHLTTFDRDLLLLAAAPSFSLGHAERIRRDSGDPRPSVGLALELAGGGALSPELVLARLLPGAPLRRNALVELRGDGPFVAQRLVVPDVVWQRMLGLEDERVLPARPELALPEAIRERISTVTAALRHRSGVVVVRGPRESGRTGVARAVAAALDRFAIELPAAPAHEVIREARWHRAIPIVEWRDDLEELQLACPVIALVAEPATPVPARATVYEIAVQAPDRAARAAIWRSRLPALPDPEQVAGAYRFGPARIEAAAQLAVTSSRLHGGPLTTEHALDACRRVAPATTLRLAQPCEATHSLADLVLTSGARRELDLALAWGRHRATAGAEGLTCLFCGPSGTGKTTAASAFARELGLAIHRVDLSRVVDKYIGETEKNLARLFDEAEATSAVLFFDEADALFAKRIDVRDAHDRFANVETGFLLQRLESHTGIVLLATNLRRNFDDAFARRIQVIVDFPFPERAERTLLWERMLPPDHSVDIKLLASTFALAGGDIRNAVAAASVLAAAEGCPIAMRHMIVATWREIQRSGRLGRGDEFAAWHAELAPWVRS